MLEIGCFVWLWEMLYLSKQNVGTDALIESTKDGRVYLTNVTLRQFCSKNNSNISWYLLAILSGTYFITFYYKCFPFVSLLNPCFREKMWSCQSNSINIFIRFGNNFVSSKCSVSMSQTGSHLVSLCSTSLHS